MAQSDEYVLDVPYDRTFVPDLAPSRLRLVAALNGFAPPPSRDFDYLELGAGHGFTTATLAAACPQARFVGVDINPDHVASANRLIAAGALTNIRFLECDFEDLARHDLPKFDYIGAHGVLSWVGAHKRKALIDFATAKLKPGGLLYASYNALPGWAAVEPLRRLIVERAATASGDTLERARHGVELAKRLSSGDALYFVGNPAARAMLATMEQMGLAYVVHEYLHSHWVPMYFADVAREMATADLHFVGQMPLHLNYRDLSVPASISAVLEDVTDRFAFETLKDYALNEFFRCDVYIKGNAPRSDLVTEAYFDGTPFGVGETPLRREVRLPHHTLQFTGAIFDVLFPALTEGCCTVSELAQRPELLDVDVSRIRDAVVRLTLAGQLVPMLRGAPVRRSDTRGTLRVASPYNRMVLAQRLSSETPVVLVSEVLGTGISIPLLQVLALRLLTEVDPADWRSWISDLISKQPFRLKEGERTIDEASVLPTVLNEVERLKSQRLARMLQLGIVEST